MRVPQATSSPRQDLHYKRKEKSISGLSDKLVKIDASRAKFHGAFMRLFIQIEINLFFSLFFFFFVIGIDLSLRGLISKKSARQMEFAK